MTAIKDLSDPDDRKLLRDPLMKEDFHEYLEELNKMEQGERLSPDFYKSLLHLLTPHVEKWKQKGSPWRQQLHYEMCRAEFLSGALENTNESSKKMGRFLEWLSICRNLKNEQCVLYFAIGERDRETEMDCVLYDQQGRLRCFFREPFGQKYVPGIMRFFLRMYDLPKAFRLAMEVAQDWKASSSPARRLQQAGFSFIWIACWLVALAVACVALGGPISLEQVRAAAAVWPRFHWPPNFLQTLLAFGYLLAAASILMAFSRFKLLFRCIVPRMFAGIVTGYLILVFPKDFWKLTANLADSANMVMVIVFAVGAAYLFLINEIRNTIRDPVRIFSRSLNILLMGLVQAIYVGILTSDLVGKSANGSTADSLPGIFGLVYPDYVLISAPLALLLGIFVQIIWDEKPISEPF
ncbi:MAG: hypothetical protein ACE5IR_12870 [bacterium]